MIKCLNKYGFSFETINPCEQIQKEMPLWHHPGINRIKRQINNSEIAQCLRKNHAMLMVSEGMDLAQRLDEPSHEKHDSCDCEDCDRDHTLLGCNKPHACVKAVAARLGQILPKWIPVPGEGETPSGDDEPADAGGDSVNFKPPTNIKSLAQGHDYEKR
ncbi:hypothetical protein DFH07DRAFT_735479 [Mycena maculata]|uniref:Uncharacterized protein n=1 Tax=Mycena maculata TaxID=230809 RepID=A0AAD7NPJ9_9AGAR|nr:hypothetical protein DFH07DRAFT_735479 [Mycena maculata]